jgi:hypothetical protein
MLSNQENQRLAEIEFYLKVSDPKFVARMARRATRRRSKFLRWLLGR